MSREPKTLLPEIKQADAKYKLRLKQYADKRRKTSTHQLMVGDTVIVKKEKAMIGKAESFYEWQSLKVTKVLGSMITARCEKTGRETTRNSSFFKKFANLILN